jgi:uncharacterized protein YllA (UPF0747 family)
MKTVFVNEITNNQSHKAVMETAKIFPSQYKQQAFSRPINLFYLNNNIRERLEQIDENNFKVNNTEIVFSEEALLQLIETNPELFSPNVILRGLYQEKILPNVMFIGGGGEIAYWLQLKNVFDVNQVPFPILHLRNSFIIGTQKQKTNWQHFKFSNIELFDQIPNLEKKYVTQNSNAVLNTDDEKNELNKIYEAIINKTDQIDSTLKNHVLALQTKQINKLLNLDKKMLKKQKQSFSTTLAQIKKLKTELFPNNQLQERFDNIIPYYAKYGNAIFDVILEHSNTEENNFSIIWLADAE